MITMCCCALPPRGFQRSKFKSTVTVAPNGDFVVLGAALHGDFREAPIRRDVSRRRWSAGPAGPPRISHAAARLHDGRILVAGGLDGDTADRSTAADLYDPGSRTWRSVAAMNTPRSLGAQAVRLRDGRVLVMGGFQDGAAPAAAEVYDPSTNRWAVLETHPGCGRLGWLAPLLDGSTLLVNDTCAVVLDPRAREWKELPRPPRAHTHGTATALIDGRVILVGGGSDGTPALVSSIYDPRTAAWSDGPTLRRGRTAHTTTRMGHVLVVAGGRRFEVDREKSGRRMHSVEVFDLRDGRHVQRSLGVRRSDHVAAPLPNGDVLLIGGSIGLIFNNFPSHRYVRFRLPRRFRDATRSAG